MIITPLIFMKNIRNVSTGARESMTHVGIIQINNENSD